LAAEDKGKESLRVGQYGYSLDIIEDGKQGFCYFDGERHKVKAGGGIRKWAEVILITTVPEPTVIETWSVFPLSYALTEGGFQTVGQATPLPTSMNKAATWTNINKTDTSTTVLKAPSATTKKIRVKYLILSNNQATVVEVGITFKSSPSAAADYPIRVYLPADGGNLPLNLTDANIEGAAGETLYAYCAAAYSSGVHFSVATEEV